MARARRELGTACAPPRSSINDPLYNRCNRCDASSSFPVCYCVASGVVGAGRVGGRQPRPRAPPRPQSADLGLLIG